jgi:hypothetical protein
VSGWRTDLVIVACAISAGIHGALVPVHFEEGTGAGVGFVVATLLLGALVVALTLRPASGLALAGAALAFAGLIASYAFAITTGLPVLHPGVEPVESLALFTKAVEGAGLAAAVLTLQPKGTLKWTAHGLRARSQSF